MKLLLLPWLICSVLGTTIVAQELRSATPVSEQLSERTNWYVTELPSGTLLLSSVEGLNIVTGNKTTVLRPTNSQLYDGNIQSRFYASSDSTVLFCSYRGYYELNTKNFTLTPHRLQDEGGEEIASDYSIVGLNNDRLYIKTAQGIASVDVSSKKIRWHSELNVTGANCVLWGRDNTSMVIAFGDRLLKYGLGGDNKFQRDTVIFSRPSRRWVTYADEKRACLINDSGQYFEFRDSLQLMSQLPYRRPRSFDISNHIAWLNYGQYISVYDLEEQKQLKQLNFISSVTSWRLDDISQVQIVDSTSGLISCDGEGVFGFEINSPFTTPDWGDQCRLKSKVTAIHNNGKYRIIATEDDGIRVTDLDFNLVNSIVRDESGQTLKVRQSTVYGDKLVYAGLGTGLGIINTLDGDVEDLLSSDRSRYWFQLTALTDGRIIGSSSGEGIGELIIDDNAYVFKKLLDCEESDKFFTYFKWIRDDLLLISDNEEKVLLSRLVNDTIIVYQELDIPGVTDAFLFDGASPVIYISNSEGLFQVVLGGETMQRRLIVNEAHLPCEVHAVVGDSLGRLWLTTNRGILCYYPTSNESIRYTQSDGVLSTEFNSRARLLDRNHLAFGGLDGLTVFNPYEVSIDSMEVQVVITRIDINDKPVAENLWKGNNAWIGDLSYKERTLTIEAQAIDYARPDNLNLKYRLKGQDDEWVIVGRNSMEVRYPKLEPQEYELEVVASNSSGVWNQSPYSLSFVIRPPFWMTIWFRILVLGMISMIMYALYALRLRILRREFAAVDAERSRIASDVHDDLGGSFSSINALSQRALKYASDEAQAVRIKKLATVAESTSTRLREVIWAMDSRNDTSERLGIYLRRTSTQFLEQNDMRHNFKLELKEKAATIRAEKRRAVTLVLKEVLHNAIKHSGAQRIDIDLLQAENFSIRIEEVGGAGFDIDDALNRGGHGVFNMHKRLKEVGGKIEFRKNAKSFVTTISITFDKTL